MKNYLKYFFLGIWTLYCVFGIIKNFKNYGLDDWIVVILIAVLPYFIIWFLNHKTSKIKTSMENNTIPGPIAPEITSNHIEPVSSTSDSDVESDSVISISDEVPSVQYVETGNVVYRTDGKSITDEEIPYLIRDGYAKTTANWKVPSLIRQVTESYQIICKTNDPETLCSRYNFIVEKIDELAIFEQQGLLDKNSFTQYKALITDDNHYKLILSCYYKYNTKAHTELKTQNGIDKRLNKFWKIIYNNVRTDFYNTYWKH